MGPRKSLGQIVPKLRLEHIGRDWHLPHLVAVHEPHIQDLVREVENSQFGVFANDNGARVGSGKKEYLTVVVTGFQELADVGDITEFDRQARLLEGFAFDALFQRFSALDTAAGWYP